MSTSVLPNVELAFWNLGDNTPVGIDRAQALLGANNLNPERARPIPFGTAFRRAIDELRAKDILVRPFTRKADGVLCAQVDKETESNGQLSRRMVSVYALEGMTPTLVKGDRQVSLEDAYHAALMNYNRGDLSAIIQQIFLLDGLGSYSPRKAGGVYFVPTNQQCKDLLDNIGRFCDAVGIRLLRYTIPDEVGQREEIGQAIYTALMLDLQVHTDAINAYTENTPDGVLENRRTSLDGTRQLAFNLANFLGNYATVIQANITEVNRILFQKQEAFELTRSETPRPRRRIVTT